MIAVYKIKAPGWKDARYVTVQDVRDDEHAKALEQVIAQRNGVIATLVSVEGYALGYTLREIENERNLFGKTRRYSTGERTVVIPEN